MGWPPPNYPNFSVYRELMANISEHVHECKPYQYVIIWGQFLIRAILVHVVWGYSVVPKHDFVW